MKLAAGLAPERLTAELAAGAHGLTGADIAFVCQRAVALCVKEAARGVQDAEGLALGQPHFQAALAQLSGARSAPVHRRLVVAG